MDFKQFALSELKSGTSEDRTIEGFGAVFGNIDSQNDIVMLGAFAKSIAAGLPAMLWQHKQDQPIGIWDEMRETDQGLYVKGRILDTALGNDAYKLAKAGALKGMSIGYSTKDYAIDKKTGIRQLKELALFEVSLVTFPANDRATITRVKTAHENERDFEEFLREAGYPRDAAKIITARGFKALSGQREAEAGGLSPEQNAELANLFKKFQQHLTQ